jgi:hypothetical protein
MLGEHTRAVLTEELGYGPAEVDALVAAGVAHALKAGAGDAEVA